MSSFSIHIAFGRANSWQRPTASRAYHQTDANDIVDVEAIPVGSAHQAGSVALIAAEPRPISPAKGFQSKLGNYLDVLA